MDMELFDMPGAVVQTAAPEESSHSLFWVQSGGKLVLQNGVGQTMSGDAPVGSFWHEYFKTSDPVETDGGAHPQNIFRVLTKDTHADSAQEVDVYVSEIRKSPAPSRKASNGIFLISRYGDDGADGYYAGVRVDGDAVIKKKTNGVFHTLDLRPAFASPGRAYDREAFANIIPEKQWFGLRMAVETGIDGRTTVSLYLDRANTGAWQLIAQGVDNGRTFGGATLLPGRGGIQTDFMDAMLDNYAKGTAMQVALAPAPAAKPSAVPQAAHLSPRADQRPTPPVSGAEPPSGISAPSARRETTADPSGPRRFVFSFSPSGVIEEAGSMRESKHPHFWLNSGAYLYMENGIGRTVFGELPIGSKWQIAFNDYNPASTDGGVHPQNILRLITKDVWQDQTQEVYFNMQALNKSAGDKRNGSNGVLLLSRYADGDNLYYAGIRVDGKAVIKKKIRGTYYTLSLRPVYEGKYHRDSKPNLIPLGQWIGLRSVVKNLPDGSVRVDLYMDTDRSGAWKLVATAVDDGKKYGGSGIRQSAHAGIRTDFMDVYFDDYRIEEIAS